MGVKVTHDYSASYSHSKPVSWLSRLSVSLCDNIVKRTIKVKYNHILPFWELQRTNVAGCFFFFHHKEYVKALTFQVLWRSGSEINNICEGSWHVASFSLYWGTFPTGLLVASEASHFINWKKKKKSLNWSLVIQVVRAASWIFVWSLGNT